MSKDPKFELKKKIYKNGANPEYCVAQGQRLLKEAKERKAERKRDASRNVEALVKQEIGTLSRLKNGVRGTFYGFGEGQKGSAGRYVLNPETGKLEKI